MITMTQTSTGDVWTYSYNFLNLMTGAVEKTSTGTILAQATYTYDALDNRIGMDKMVRRRGRSMTVPIRSWTSTALAPWKCGT